MCILTVILQIWDKSTFTTNQPINYIWIRYFCIISRKKKINHSSLHCKPDNVQYIPTGCLQVIRRYCNRACLVLACPDYVIMRQNP